MPKKKLAIKNEDKKTTNFKKTERDSKAIAKEQKDGSANEKKIKFNWIVYNLIQILNK